MRQMTQEELEAHYGAMTPEEIDAEVVRLKVEATQLFNHTVRLKDWHKARMRRANRRTVK